MEDKYFNEFFDKLYNGKLNIYEDEEEETSDEEGHIEMDTEEDGDDNEQNYIIPKNPNYSLDELNRILNEIPQNKFSSTKTLENIVNSLFDGIKKIKENNYSELRDYFKQTYLNFFWEL